MKNKLQRAYPVVLLFLLSTLSSCDLIVGIFKGGMYFGIILVVVVVALVIWLLSRIGRGGRD